MKNAIQDLNRLRQPNVLPFLASWTCYLGNLGLYPQIPDNQSAYQPGCDRQSPPHPAIPGLHIDAQDRQLLSRLEG